jgi:hypothetical protein
LLISFQLPRSAPSNKPLQLAANSNAQSRHGSILDRPKLSHGQGTKSRFRRPASPEPRRRSARRKHST